MPRFDLMAGKHLVPITFEATRGCPFSCDFCALSGIGTRYHTRPPACVARDVRHGRRLLKGRVPEMQRRFIGFLDNNIGGNPRYLAELCRTLERLEVRWGAAIAFNALS